MRLFGGWRAPVLLVAVFAIAVGAWAVATYFERGDGDVVVAPVETPTPTSTATATSEPTQAQVALLIEDSAERERLGGLLDGAGFTVIDEPATGALALGDTAFDGGDELVIDAWAAVTDQRRDVLEITRDDVVAILDGEVTNWSELGGGDEPIAVYLPRDDAEAIVAAFGAGDGAHVTVAARDALADMVEEQPGSFALTHTEDLRPGILALVVDGHDPYRDPEAESPLRLERWATNEAEGIDEVLDAVGWTPRDLDLDPVGLLATGEILPVRCSYHALVERGDDGAMFDGTRELLQTADLVVSQLDTALTDRVPPSPCVSSFDLRSPTRLAEAFAEVGIVAMSTATNHHMDCDGCGAVNAMRDTIQALRDAGIEQFGSGEDVTEARKPAFVEVGGVRFAFLGYDAIGQGWYGASAVSPGTAPLRWDTLDSLAEDVAAAKAQADHVIVHFSWSFAEYVTWPDDLQRAAAHVIEEAGGSLIVGNGPHIVQAAEMIDEMFVAYSLGNFIYDQAWSIPPGADGLSNYETVDNVLMETGFTADRLLGYRFRPAVIREMHRPDLVDPASAEGERIMSRLWGAVDALEPWEGASPPPPADPEPAVTEEPEDDDDEAPAATTPAVTETVVPTATAEADDSP